MSSGGKNGRAVQLGSGETLFVEKRNCFAEPRRGLLRSLDRRGEGGVDASHLCLIHVGVDDGDDLIGRGRRNDELVERKCGRREIERAGDVGLEGDDDGDVSDVSGEESEFERDGESLCDSSGDGNKARRGSCCCCCC